MVRSALRAATVLIAIMAPPAAAHDFFLLPERFTGPTGDVAIRATVGSSFPKPEIAVTPDRVSMLAAFGAGGAYRLEAGAAVADALALRLTGATPGLAVAAMSTQPREVDYAEDRIDFILEEYDVGPAAKRLVEAMPKPRTLRAVSHRFAKTLVCLDACTGDAAAQPAGFDLEWTAAEGGHRLLADGRPLAGHPAVVVDAAAQRHALQTDAQGRVRVPAGLPGPVMLFAATLTPPATPDKRFTLRLSSLTLAGG